MSNPGLPTNGGLGHQKQPLVPITPLSLQNLVVTPEESGRHRSVLLEEKRKLEAAELLIEAGEVNHMIMELERQQKEFEARSQTERQRLEFMRQMITSELQNKIDPAGGSSRGVQLAPAHQTMQSSVAPQAIQIHGRPNTHAYWGNNGNTKEGIAPTSGSAHIHVATHAAPPSSQDTQFSRGMFTAPTDQQNTHWRLYQAHLRKDQEAILSGQSNFIQNPSSSSANTLPHTTGIPQFPNAHPVTTSSSSTTFGQTANGLRTAGNPGLASSFQQAVIQQQYNQQARHRYNPSSSSLAGALGPPRTQEAQARISPVAEQQPTRQSAVPLDARNVQAQALGAPFNVQVKSQHQNPQILQVQRINTPAPNFVPQNRPQVNAPQTRQGQSGIFPVNKQGNAQSRQNNFVPGNSKFYFIQQNAPPTQRLDHEALSRMHLASGTHQQIVGWHSQAPTTGQQAYGTPDGIPLPSVANTYSPRQLPLRPQTPNQGSTTDLSLQPPTTPKNQINPPVKPVTPASADRKHLARDLLFALGRRPAKRPRSVSPDPQLTPKVTDPGPSTKPADRAVQEPANILPVFDEPGPVEEVSTPSSAEEVELVVDDLQPSTTTTPKNHPMELPTPQIPILLNRSSVTSGSSPKRLSQIPASSSYAIAPGSLVTESPFTSQTVMPDNSTKTDLLQADSLSLRRASSELVEENNTDALPLFLPSPSLQIDSASSSKDVLRRVALRSAENRKPQFEVYVEVPTLAECKQRKLGPWRDIKGKSRAMRTRFIPYQPPNTSLPLGSMQRNIPVASSLVQKFQSSAKALNVQESRPFSDEELKLFKAAAQLSLSRLMIRPCLWLGCDHLFNSGKNLEEHVVEHALKLSDFQPPYKCDYDGCERKFLKVDVLTQHLRRHVSKLLPCPYLDCDEQFMLGQHLFQHIQEAKHPERKIRSVPKLVPCIPGKNTTLPETLPSYRSVNLPIRRPQISKERHEKLGPWVLRNIFGPVNTHGPRHNARYPLRGPRQSKEDTDSEKKPSLRRDQYDFLDSPENIGDDAPPICDDLESAELSELVERGLVFAPDIAGPQGLFLEQRLTCVAARQPHIPEEVLKELYGTPPPPETLPEIDGGFGPGGLMSLTVGDEVDEMKEDKSPQIFYPESVKVWGSSLEEIVPFATPSSGVNESGTVNIFES